MTVGVVAAMRTSMLRRAVRDSPGPAVAALAGLLAAGWLIKYAVGGGANADTLAILAGTWVLGWIVLPLLLGGVRGRVRPVHLRLEPIAPVVKAFALLTASAIGIGPAVSLLALLALPAHAAVHHGFGPAVAALAGALLLWLAGLAGSAVALEAVGRTDGPVGAVLTGVLTGAVMGVLGSLWAVAPWAGSLLVHGPPAGVVSALRFVPSTWPLHAATGSYALLMLLLAVTAVIVGAYFLLTMGDRAVSRRSGRLPVLGGARKFPAGAVQGVALRERRTWIRHPLRLQYLAFAVVYGALLAGLPLLADVRLLLPWAGPLAVLWAAAMSASMIGLDGTALWLPMVTPGGERAEVRGRSLAWLTIVAPIGIVLTIAGALSARDYRPLAAFAVLPALLGAGASAPVWVSMLRAKPVDDPRRPTAADNPTDIVSVLLTMVIAIITAAPPFILAVWGPRFLAFPVGIICAYAAWALFDRIAVDYLRQRGRDVLTSLGQRTAAPSVQVPLTWDPEWIKANKATVWALVLLTVGWIPVVPQGLMVLVFDIKGGWIVASHLTGTAHVVAAWSMVALGAVMLLTGLILWGRRPAPALT